MRPFPPCWSDTIVGYRLARTAGDTVWFERIGIYRPTAFQRLVDRTSFRHLSFVGGLLYASGYGGGTLGSALTVLDTRGPRPMRRVGHFAAPGAYLAGPLPDGRVLVAGGRTLRLVGRPPNRPPS